MWKYICILTMEKQSSRVEANSRNRSGNYMQILLRCVARFISCPGNSLVRRSLTRGNKRVMDTRGTIFLNWQGL